MIRRFGTRYQLYLRKNSVGAVLSEAYVFSTVDLVIASCVVAVAGMRL